MLKTTNIPAEADRKVREEIVAAYKRSPRRLLLLDYDGTLVPFASRPQEAIPGPKLIRLMQRLCSFPGNDVAIISGRTRPNLLEWFGDLDVSLVAEHGAWLRRRGRARWTLLGRISTTWKPAVAPILEDFQNRVPGSRIEEKEFSLAWHYRRADPKSAASHVEELFKTLEGMLAKTGIDVVEGNKVLEVHDSRISKGRAALHLLRDGRFEFVLALGDDNTDETMFCALPRRAYTIKVGRAPSRSRFHLPSQKDVPPLLRELAGAFDRAPRRWQDVGSGRLPQIGRR